MSVSRATVKADAAANKAIQQALDAGTVVAQGLNATVVKYVERMLELARAQ